MHFARFEEVCHLITEGPIVDDELVISDLAKRFKAKESARRPVFNKPKTHIYELTQRRS